MMLHTRERGFHTYRQLLSAVSRAIKAGPRGRPILTVPAAPVASKDLHQDGADGQVVTSMPFGVIGIPVMPHR
jgi:hypothetical protein